VTVALWLLFVPSAQQWWPLSRWLSRQVAVVILSSDKQLSPFIPMNQGGECFGQQDQHHLANMGYAHSVDNHQPVIVGGPSSAVVAMGHPPDLPPISSDGGFAYPSPYNPTPSDPGTPCSTQNIFSPHYYYNGLQSPILDISTFWPPAWPFPDVLTVVLFVSHLRHLFLKSGHCLFSLGIRCWP
jgi:hypothetical protein